MTGKRNDLVKKVWGCVRSCNNFLNSGSDHALDQSIDNGRWSSAKKKKKGSMLEGNGTIVPVLFPTPSTGWHVGMLEKC